MFVCHGNICRLSAKPLFKPKFGVGVLVYRGFTGNDGASVFWKILYKLTIDEIFIQLKDGLA